MRVKWSEYVDMPEEFYEQATIEDFSMLRNDYAGEVVACVRAWGETKFVVMLDTGTTREVKASLVTRQLQGETQP